MEKALYVLAGYDSDTDAHLAGIQNRLYEQGFSGMHTKDIPQHITLGSFPAGSEDEVVQLMRSTAEKTPSFEVTFNHAGIFGGARVLFIAPDTNEELLHLKEAFGPAADWTAHTTMLIDEPEIIYKAVPIVMDSFSAFSGKVTSLHLYEFFPARYITTVSLR